MKDLIHSARITYGQSGGCEILALGNNEGLRELFAQRQKIIAEMNAARITAVKEAEKPFLKSLEELDKQYAMILSMMGD